MHWWQVAVVFVLWCVVIYRWRTGKKRRHKEMVAATAGYLRGDSRGGF